MLLFIAAVALAQTASADPSLAAQDQAQPGVSAPAMEPRRSKWDEVHCHTITTLSGIGEKVCVTNREWRQISLEHQREVGEYQLRMLTTQIRR